MCHHYEYLAEWEAEERLREELTEDEAEEEGTVVDPPEASA